MPVNPTRLPAGVGSHNQRDVSHEYQRTVQPRSLEETTQSAKRLQVMYLKCANRLRCNRRTMIPQSFQSTGTMRTWAGTTRSKVTSKVNFARIWAFLMQSCSCTIGNWSIFPVTTTGTGWRPAGQGSRQTRHRRTRYKHRFRSSDNWRDRSASTV